MITFPSSLTARVLTIAVLSTSPLFGWDYEGHRTVNHLALSSLPEDFPAFVHEPANTERIAFLAGEPDRWRNVPDLILKQSGGSWEDHFMDIEQLSDAGIDPKKLTSFRYDFILQFSAGRQAHPEKFPTINAAKNSDHTQEWPGFAPYAIAEYYTRLRSGFTYLKAFEAFGGTAEEVANAKADIVYQMGILGHYVADCAQPLHTTLYHNGWTGENPHGYTTWSGFHSWIDGRFMEKAKISYDTLLPRIQPAAVISLAPRPDNREPLFVAVMDYLIEQNSKVEPLYQMEREGKFSDELEKTGKFDQDPNPVNPDGKAFIEAQLLKGGEMLGSIWLTAYRSAVPDTYLRSQLIRRKERQTPRATSESAAK